MLSAAEAVDTLTRAAIKKLDAQIRALKIERKALLSRERRSCPQCGADFTPVRRDAKFCSPKCRYAHFNALRGT